MSEGLNRLRYPISLRAWVSTSCLILNEIPVESPSRHRWHSVTLEYRFPGLKPKVWIDGHETSGDTSAILQSLVDEIAPVR